MVVLVRCSDGFCSVALESCLDRLAGEGLITAYLLNGEWIPATKGAAVKRISRIDGKRSSVYATTAAA